MPLTAIISDIHANELALEAVLEDAEAHGVERIWCLGDIVGYGSDPVACLAQVKEIAQHVIKGNHEQAVLVGPIGFNPLASQAITWTRRQLEAVDDFAEGLGYLERLGHRIDEEEAVLVHGSPSQPLDEYLFREDTIDHMPRGLDFSPKLARSFQLIDRPCFVGHTHVPGAIGADMTWTSPHDVGGTYETRGEPCIINVGSVGQPRDGDTRAAYAWFDGRTVTWRRVEYDHEASARKILAEDGLPDMLGQRLMEGW